MDVIKKWILLTRNKRNLSIDGDLLVFSVMSSCFNICICLDDETRDNEMVKLVLSKMDHGY
jgi:hypothetical protein